MSSARADRPLRQTWCHPSTAAGQARAARTRGLLQNGAAVVAPGPRARLCRPSLLSLLSEACVCSAGAEVGDVKSSGSLKSYVLCLGHCQGEQRQVWEKNSILTHSINAWLSVVQLPKV